jgi:hypothetical protein
VDAAASVKPQNMVFFQPVYLLDPLPRIRYAVSLLLQRVTQS